MMGREELCTMQPYVRATGREVERAITQLKAWREAER